jgi:ABC-2 type transport system permease protein
MSAVRAVTKLQFRILRRDPIFLVVMFGMPLAIMPLLRKTMGLSLAASGYPGADGAEQVVPGQIVLFGFFVAGSTAFALYREHGWRTWDRLRASPASPRAILIGFAIPWTCVHAAYQTVLLVAGGLVFGLRLNGGSPVALGLLVWAFAFCVVSIVLLGAATLRTVNQLQALVNIGALVLGGIGGALIPIEQLPGWAQAVAPVTPQYWAMEGHLSIFLESGGLRDVWPSFVVLVSIGIVAAALAMVRFREDETKEFFA